MVSFTFLLKLSEFSVVLILSSVLFHTVGADGLQIDFYLRIFSLLSAKEEISASFEFYTDYLSSPPFTKEMTVLDFYVMYFMSKFWDYFYNPP